MLNRRKFIEKAAAAGALSLLPRIVLPNSKIPVSTENKGLPVIISTWVHGLDANEQAMKTLLYGGSVLDAVERVSWFLKLTPKTRALGWVVCLTGTE